MRISGLASGIDTEKIVADLMKAHRIPMDKITQKKQYLEWQLDDYRAANRQVLDFKNRTFDTMILSKSFTAKTVNISSPDDVAIKNISSTSDFSGSIKVTQLAKNATLQSGKSIKFEMQLTEDTKDDSEAKEMQSENTKLKNLGITGTVLKINAPDKDGNMPDKPVEITFDPATDTINSVLSKINELTGVSAFFDSHTGKFAMTAKNSGAGNIEVDGDLGKSLGLNTGPKTFFAGIDASEIKKMRITIKVDGKDEELDFSAWDGINKKIDFSKKGLEVIYNNETKDFTVNILNDSVGKKIESVTVTNTNDPDYSLSISISTSTAGQNAEFTFNGLTTQRASNTFQINGFEVTLKGVNTEGINFSSAPDTDKIFDNVVKYVDEYNKLIEDLNKQIREPKYRDFQPLSAEQKKDMTDKDIELWEEKAKSGTLRNDSTISSMLTQMRTALMGAINGKTLKDIGIETTSDYLANGKLTIKEDKLKEAISADPNKVHQMFSKDENKLDEDGNPVIEDGKNVKDLGFAQRLKIILESTESSIAERAGKAGAVNDTFSLGRSLKDMDNQIERFEDRLKMMENRYWRQFSAMETAINRANSQSASLMNAFSNS
ncbi:flagellar filament capping protein FliD [Filibacter tadaridae]|uniref:Flagellar hook-associated protein 2 n=1 Tax=Filibacter tadaridae TaxID=2483811 RepID=A0A3P5X0W5_9BACL|nr:flagellar filament capping protein FliD [Filibacter tadaridae]VDC27571.1 Flagellar hook-associated protein 2 [Filibacter tadaridae]